MHDSTEMSARRTKLLADAVMRASAPFHRMAADVLAWDNPTMLLKDGAFTVIRSPETTALLGQIDGLRQSFVKLALKDYV